VDNCKEEGIVADNFKITFKSIPDNLIEKWQGITDILANILSVRAALIMKTEDEYLEVFVSSRTANNPYHVGNREKCNSFFCETVIKTQNESLIPDAKSDLQWNNNPDFKPGMVAYLGFPVNYPNKRPFGTLCVLDSKKNCFSLDHRNLLKQFSSVLEMDLAYIDHQRHMTELHKELKESEHQYHTVADSGPALIWTSGLDKKYDYFNRPWLEFTGRTLEQELGDGWIMGVHSEDLQHCVDIYTNAFERREKFCMTYRLRRASGEYCWIQGDGTPRYDSNGNFLGFIGYCLDISNSLNAEKSLKENEERFRAIVEGAPDPMFVQTEEKFAYLNSRAVHLFGAVKETDLLGMPVMDRFDPVIHKQIRERIRQLNDERQPVIKSLEQQFLRLDGSKVWVETTGQPIVFEGKKGALVFVRDITEHKQSEHSLATERERLAVTLRSIGDGVITTDIEGNIVLMNNVAEELTGWKQVEAEGRSLSSVFMIMNESTREPYENPVTKVLLTGKVIELANHTLLISRNGTERVIANSGAPIKDKDGKIIGVVLVFRDTTEKQKFLEITQNAQKLESLGILAGGIAHDFNNLLGGIYGYIDMAGEYLEDGNVSRFLSKAATTIDRARDLTRQLLTFSKGGAPVQKVEKLFPFVQETAQFALSGSDVSCYFDVPQDLWACNFDKNQLGQVIDNIIINAVQAMPVGGVITLTARNVTLSDKEHPILAKGKYVKLSIKDSGTGIPKELLTRIFDPFFTTKSKGHGLGLATCYSIINRHSGCIDVDSELGKGSVFHVFLPATEEMAYSSGKKSVSQHIGSGTFLVMDDEDVICETIGCMLESFGYTVVRKNNGQDAIDFLAMETNANRSLSGMIFDLTIPGGMGGKEAIAEIRKLNNEIPVFVISGYAEGSFIKNPVNYGFTASICKPFRRIELMEMLEKHMKARNN
jgi:PAS domain S-box-containing protein